MPDSIEIAAAELNRVISSVRSADSAAALAVLGDKSWAILEAAFWSGSHPLDSSSRKAFSDYCVAVELLWQKFGAGSIRPITVFRSTLGDAPSVDASLRILAKLYIGCNLAYAPAPDGFWRTVFSITGYVVSQCREREDPEFQALQNLCMQLWLMAWLNPHSLVTGRLPVAVRLLAIMSKTCTFSLSPPTHGGSGLAAADLMEDRAPMPFVRLAGNWAPQLPLYVNAQSAAYAMEALKDASPRRPGGDLYEALLGAGRIAGLTDAEVSDFVKRALREFGQTHTRSIPRIASQGFVYAVPKMLDVWAALQSHSPSDLATGSADAPLLAQVVNHSEGGFLLKFKPNRPTLRAGSLLVIRGTETEPWTLGIIRWLQDATREVTVGVEVMSNFAQAQLSIENASTHAPIIRFHSDTQDQVLLPLGHADASLVVQIRVEDELWVLSATQQLGEDWEMRGLLDTVAT